MSEDLNSGYWNKLYHDKDTRWDVGHISTPLKEYFDGLTDKTISILIPGAGNSYEGEYLLQQGFTNVTILDYAPQAIENFKQRVPIHKQAKLICTDFFMHTGKYDLIIEQTFFCAIDPCLRNSYAKKMHELLTKGGKLAGLLFTEVPNSGGPPFGGTRQEYVNLFSPYFTIEKMEICKNSIKPRQGRELFFILGKKD